MKKCLYQKLWDYTNVNIPKEECRDCPYDRYGNITIHKHDIECPDYVRVEEKSSEEKEE